MMEDGFRALLGGPYLPFMKSTPRLLELSSFHQASPEQDAALLVVCPDPIAVHQDALKQELSTTWTFVRSLRLPPRNYCRGWLLHRRNGNVRAHSRQPP